MFLTGPTLRRQHLDSRMRQKYAWMFHCSCPSQSTDHNYLWWYYPTRDPPRGLSLHGFQERRYCEYIWRLWVIWFAMPYKSSLSGLDETLKLQVLSLLGKLTMSSDLMSSVMLVLVLALAAECTRMLLFVIYRAGFCWSTEESANTMSSALEVLGMSLPYSSSTPALYPGSLSCIICLAVEFTFRMQEKTQECFKAAKYLKKLLELDLKPKCVPFSFHQLNPDKHFWFMQRHPNTTIVLERHCNHQYTRGFYKRGWFTDHVAVCWLIFAAGYSSSGDGPSG